MSDILDKVRVAQIRAGEDAAESLQKVIDYLNELAKWKEKEGFVEVPKEERLTAKELNRIKLHILGYH